MSGRNRIEKLTLHRFRGATGTTEVTFDPGKPVVFIFGENGSERSLHELCCGQAALSRGT